MTRDEVSKWATWIEGGIDDGNEDFTLARELLAGLPDAAARPIRALLFEAPQCKHECECTCTHVCEAHHLGGGACTECKCTLFFAAGDRGRLSPPIIAAFQQAEQALLEAPLTVPSPPPPEAVAAEPAEPPESEERLTYGIDLRTAQARPLAGRLALGDA